jgi:hypothetical protein
MQCKLFEAALNEIGAGEQFVNEVIEVTLEIMGGKIGVLRYPLPLETLWRETDCRYGRKQSFFAGEGEARNEQSLRRLHGKPHPPTALFPPLRTLWWSNIKATGDGRRIYNAAMRQAFKAEIGSLAPLEVYLRSSGYEPDAEYVDGKIEQRSMGERTAFIGSAVLNVGALVVFSASAKNELKAL